LFLALALVVGCLYVQYSVAHQTDAAPVASASAVTPTDKAADPSDGHSSRKKKSQQKKNQQASKSKTSSPKQTKKSKRKGNGNADLATIDYEAENLPLLPGGVSSTLLYRRGYTLSYNAEFRQPNWVTYELLESELGGKEKRKDFQPDPDLGDKSPQLTDYRSSGYDRGHLAPAADFSWDSLAMVETFYLSNISPQGHDFNAGIWLALENQVRQWAKADSAICIVTGPVLTDAGLPSERKYISRQANRILVPQYFYKVILAPFAETPRAIGFIMPNQNSNSPLRSFAVSVDSVETLTGIDFFPQLPDAVERAVESQCRPEDWGL
jgi:endonuclease G